MATQKNTTNDRKSPEQFKKDIARARQLVCMELNKHNIAVDTRLLTTISVLTTAALKFVEGTVDGKETRASFDNAMDMYLNNNMPF